MKSATKKECVIFVKGLGMIACIDGGVVVLTPSDGCYTIRLSNVLLATRAGAIVDDTRHMLNTILQREK